MRAFCTVPTKVVLFAVLLQLAFAEIARSEGSPPQQFARVLDEFRAIKEKCEKKRRLIYDQRQPEIKAAKTEIERQSLQLEMIAKADAELSSDLRQAFDALNPHADEPATAEAFIWIAKYQSTTDVGPMAIGVLMEHHLTHPQTLDFAYFAKTSSGRWIEPMLRAQVASASLPERQRPRQTLALAMCLQRQAENGNGESTKREEEAVKLFTELNQRFPSTPLIPGLTVGGVAKSSLFEIQNLGVGKTVPEIEGPDLNGESFKLSDYRGKVVLLSFWGTWCSPCMALVPHERELAQRYKDKPFAIVGVNSDPDKSPLKRTLEQHSITWRSFWCGEFGPLGPIPRQWNIKAWPTLYVIDHEGIIRSKTTLAAILDPTVEKLVTRAQTDATRR